MADRRLNSGRIRTSGLLREPAFGLGVPFSPEVSWLQQKQLLRARRRTEKNEKCARVRTFVHFLSKLARSGRLRRQAARPAQCDRTCRSLARAGMSGTVEFVTGVYARGFGARLAAAGTPWAGIALRTPSSTASATTSAATAPSRLNSTAASNAPLASAKIQSPS